MARSKQNPDEIDKTSSVTPESAPPESAPPESVTPESAPPEAAKPEPVVSSSEALNTALSEAPQRRGRGRPRKDGSAPGSQRADDFTPSPTQRKAREENKEARREACKKAGEMTARIAFGIMATQGPGFTLDEKIEHEKLTKDFAISSTGEFFADMDWADMPPSLALAVAWGQVALVLANKEENRPKVNALKEKIKLWFQERKVKQAEAASK